MKRKTIERCIAAFALLVTAVVNNGCGGGEPQASRWDPPYDGSAYVSSNIYYRGNFVSCGRVTEEPPHRYLVTLWDTPGFFAVMVTEPFKLPPNEPVYYVVGNKADGTRWFLGLMDVYDYRNFASVGDDVPWIEH